jgi:hypothetical protein
MDKMYINYGGSPLEGQFYMILFCARNPSTLVSFLFNSILFTSIQVNVPLCALGRSAESVCLCSLSGFSLSPLSLLHRLGEQGYPVSVFLRDVPILSSHWQTQVRALFALPSLVGALARWLYPIRIH